MRDMVPTQTFLDRHRRTLQSSLEGAPETRFKRWRETTVKHNRCRAKGSLRDRSRTVSLHRKQRIERVRHIRIRALRQLFRQIAMLASELPRSFVLPVRAHWEAFCNAATPALHRTEHGLMVIFLAWMKRGSSCDSYDSSVDCGPCAIQLIETLNRISLPVVPKLLDLASIGCVGRG